MENIIKYSTYAKAEKNLNDNGFNFIKGNPLDGVLFDSMNYIAFVFRIKTSQYGVYAYKK